MQVALKSCVQFTLAGKRYKSGLLSAARHAKDLQKRGIDWNNCSTEEIADLMRESVSNGDKIGGGVSE